MTDDKWGFYEIGDFSIGVCPDPEQEEAFGLYILVGETGFALAYYPDEEAALHALEILSQAMEAIAGQHVHGPDCDHDEGEERDVTMQKPGKGKGKGKGKKAAATKGKAAKATKAAGKGKAKPAARAAKKGKAAKAARPARPAAKKKAAAKKRR